MNVMMMMNINHFYECRERLANTDDQVMNATMIINWHRFAGRGFRLHESWMCIGGIPGT